MVMVGLVTPYRYMYIQSKVFSIGRLSDSIHVSTQF